MNRGIWLLMSSWNVSCRNTSPPLEDLCMSHIIYTSGFQGWTWVPELRVIVRGSYNKYFARTTHGRTNITFSGGGRDISIKVTFDIFTAHRDLRNVPAPQFTSARCSADVANANSSFEMVLLPIKKKFNISNNGKWFE